MSEQFDNAWAGIEKGWRNGQLAHAYLLHGAPHGSAGRFVENLLNLIYDNHPQVQNRTHPDLAWIEPQSKSRQILIDQVRDDLIRPFSQTAFSGGWKVGVIVHAERMNPQAANALLKTLEEPPAKSLLILVTNEPQSLLPTISSRCQRISLTAEDEEISNVWKAPLLDLLSDLPPDSAPEAGLMTGRMMVLLNGLKKEFEQSVSETIPEDLPAKEAKALLDGRASARLIEARADMLRTMMQWQRDVLLMVLSQNADTLHFPDYQEPLAYQAKQCDRATALHHISLIEKAGRQLDRNLPAELVFENLFGQMV